MKYSLIFLGLLISTFLKLNHTMELWKNKNHNFLDYDDLNNLEESKCLDNEIGQSNIEDKIFDSLMKRKSKENEVTIFEFQDMAIDGKKLRQAPYHSTHSMPCSCGIDFHWQDLGDLYYPRYLRTGVCKSKSCGGLYRCVERHYKVKVLKQRDPRNTDTKSSLTLPDNLKEAWQPESISVTVACECSL